MDRHRANQRHGVISQRSVSINNNGVCIAGMVIGDPYVEGGSDMRNARYRRSGRERRRFNARITFEERRSWYDRRRLQDRRTGLDRRNPKGQRGWFPLGRRHASGEISVISLPETPMLKIVDTYKSRFSERGSRHKGIKF